jgi:hypothetical protein
LTTILPVHKIAKRERGKILETFGDVSVRNILEMGHYVASEWKIADWE